MAKIHYGVNGETLKNKVIARKSDIKLKVKVFSTPKVKIVEDFDGMEM